MKKFIVLLLLLFVIGCGTIQKSSSQELLPKPNADVWTVWVEKYGDGIDSHQSAVALLSIEVINRQAKAIKQLDSRLTVLEDPNR